jgi:hypothetical protein
MEGPVAQLLTAVATREKDPADSKPEADEAEHRGRHMGAPVAVSNVDNANNANNSNKNASARSMRRRVLNQTTLAFFLMGILVL